MKTAIKPVLHFDSLDRFLARPSIMRRLLLALLGLLIAACSTTTATSIEPPAEPTLGPTATPLRAPRNVYTPTEYNLLYYPTDLKLVGITGRPQFINSYADW